MNKKENRYSICGDIAKVRMSNADVDMLCDAADWEKAKGHTWSLSATGDAVSNIGGKPVPFHRFLFPGHVGDIDHINGKKLENTRENLRPVSHQQNLFNAKLSSANTSGAKGVYWHKKAQKWAAAIKVGGRSIYLGIFASFDDAKRARKQAEEKYFGEYARAV